jgi:hypothetical protein
LHYFGAIEADSQESEEWSVGISEAVTEAFSKTISSRDKDGPISPVF